MNLGKLLPAAGGVIGNIGGDILGGLAGGAIGTPTDLVDGPAGTIGGALIGAKLGGTAGGSAGQAIGQQLENLFTGTKGSTAKAGLVGGASSALGYGVGSGLKAGAGALSSLATKQGATQAAGDTASLWSSLVSKGDRENLNFNGVKNVFDKYQIPFTPESAQAAHDVVTGNPAGPGAWLSKDVIQSLQDAPQKVDLAPAAAKAAELAGSPDFAMAGNGQGGMAFLKGVNNALNSAVVREGGATPNVIAQKAPAVEAFKLQQAMETQAHQTTNPTLSAAFRSVAKEVGSAIDSSGVNDEMVKTQMNPEGLAALNSLSPKLAIEANTATTVGAKRALQSDFVKAGFLAKAAQKTQQGIVEGAPATGGGPLSSLMTARHIMEGLGGITGAAGLLTSHPAAAALGALTAAAPIAQHIATNPDVMSGAAGLVRAAGNTSPALANAAAGTYNAIPSGPAGPNQSISLGGLPVNPSAQSGTPATAAGVTPNVNPNNAAQVEALLAAQYDPQLLSSIAPSGLSGLFTPQAKAAQATSILSSLVQSFTAAGGAQGGVGGTLAKLQGKASGNAAANYEQQKAAAAAQIAQATGQNYNQVLDQLPDITMNQTQAQNALTAVQGLLSSIGGGGGTGVLSAMGGNGAAQ